MPLGLPGCPVRRRLSSLPVSVQSALFQNGLHAALVPGTPFYLFQALVEGVKGGLGVTGSVEAQSISGVNLPAGELA